MCTHRECTKSCSASDHPSVSWWFLSDIPRASTPYVRTWNFPAFVMYLMPLKGLYFSPYMSSRFTFSPVEGQKCSNSSMLTGYQTRTNTGTKVGWQVAQRFKTTARMSELGFPTVSCYTHTSQHYHYIYFTVKNITPVKMRSWNT